MWLETAGPRSTAPTGGPGHPWAWQGWCRLTLLAVLPAKPERTQTEVSVPPVDAGAPVLAPGPIAEVPLGSTAWQHRTQSGLSRGPAWPRGWRLGQKRPGLPPSGRGRNTKHGFHPHSGSPGPHNSHLGTPWGPTGYMQPIPAPTLQETPTPLCASRTCPGAIVGNEARHVHVPAVNGQVPHTAHELSVVHREVLRQVGDPAQQQRPRQIQGPAEANRMCGGMRALGSGRRPAGLPSEDPGLLRPQPGWPACSGTICQEAQGLCGQHTVLMPRPGQPDIRAQQPYPHVTSKRQTQAPTSAMALESS